MAYVGKFVGLAHAVREIARVYFGGDLAKADANLLLALNDKAVPVLSKKPGVGALSLEDFPVFYVSAHHLKGMHSILNETSWRGDCMLRRADLLKVYPRLWGAVEDGEPSLGRGRRRKSASKNERIWDLFDAMKPTFTFVRGEFSRISKEIAQKTDYGSSAIEKMIRDAYKQAKAAPRR